VVRQTCHLTVACHSRLPAGAPWARVGRRDAPFRTGGPSGEPIAWAPRQTAVVWHAGWTTWVTTRWVAAAMGGVRLVRR